MMGRTPTRRAGARSPPAAGAASGHHTGKSDIAPVAAAPEFRTPGRLKSARKAPWRSPGAALRPGDENALGHRPKSAAKSAGKPHARKLDARSPATTASAKTRAGKPKFTPANDGADADDDRTTTPAPADPASSPSRDAAPRSPMATVTNTSHTPGGVLAAVNTILLTPPSTGPKTRAVGDAGDEDAEDGTLGDEQAEAEAEATMPPPPARTPATVASLHSHPAEAETEEWPAETRTSDLDGMERRRGTRRSRAAATRPMKSPGRSPVPGRRGEVPRSKPPSSPRTEDPRPRGKRLLVASTLVKRHLVASRIEGARGAAPGVPSRRRRLPPALSMFTPGVPGGVSSLTPLTAARVPEDDTAAVNAMRLPTPTMDLTPLGRGVPTETVPFPAPAWASRPGAGATAAAATRRRRDGG